MNQINSAIPDHLRIRFLRRWQCHLMWPIAASAERRGCFRISVRGGTFSFHTTRLLRSNVQCAYLRCLTVDDNDLQAIGEFQDCEAIDLGGTDISDAGVRHLSRMQKLKYLFLWHTQVTDSCLDSLKKLKHLRILSVLNTSVSERGVEALNRSLPNCLLCLDNDQYRYGEHRDDEAFQIFLAT